MNNTRYLPPWNKKQDSPDNEAEVKTRISVFRSDIVPVYEKHYAKSFLISIMIILLLVIIGFGVYRQFIHGTATSRAAKDLKQTVASKTSSAENNTVSSISTQPYTAADYNLSFNYPDGWTVFNDGSGPMTVTSPSMMLTSATGQIVSGLVIMTIQQQGALPASFSAGTALAVLNSQLITYTHPTASQTAQAYLSFVQYSSTNTKGGLDGIYLTGNYGYQKDQVISSSDIASIDPLVTVTFTKCGNTSCTSNLTPLTIASSSWSKDALQAPIKIMLTSLIFQ